MIDTISNGINEFDFLSEILQSSKDTETEKILTDFKNKVLSYLLEKKNINDFKEILSKIIEKIIENPLGHQHTRKIASDFFANVDKYNFIEKNYEASYTLEKKESKNIFWFSVGFIILGLTLLIYTLYGCTLLELSSNYYSNLFYMTYFEGLILIFLLMRIFRINRDKRKAQEVILNVEREILDIFPILTK
jgi:hypothetical protein